MKKMYSLKTLTRKMQSFLVVMLVTLMAIGNVAAQTTYSHTIEAKTWSELGVQSLNNVDWTAAGTFTSDGYFGFSSDKGQQFGSGNKPFSELTLSTTGISGTITSVKVNTSGASNIAATFKVKVGDTYFTSNEEESITLTTTPTEYTFTGSAEGEIVLEWAQTSSKAIYLKSIEVTYTPAPVAVVAPTFTPVSGTYYATQTVTLACTTEGANIYYTLDGTEPSSASTLYTAPFTLDSTTTVKAVAIVGTNTSTIATATYTFPIATELDNIAAFKAQTSTSELFKINSDVTVIFQTADKYHTFIQDNSGAVYVYGTMDKAYNAGDVIEGGLYGKYALYKQMTELKPVSGAPIADGVAGTAVEPVVVTLDSLIANYAQYEGMLVTVEDVVVTSTSAVTFDTNRATGANVSQNGNTIQIYNTFKSLDKTVYPNNHLNVTGLVIRYNNTVEIAPRTNDDVTFAPAVTPYIVDFDENGDPGFILSNGDNTNKWYIGQAQDFDNNKLFISSTNGLTNKYNNTVSSAVSATRDIVIPAKGAVLTFTSRVNGEAGKDMLNVYLYNYTNNILKTEPSLSISLSGENEWTEHTYAISAENAGAAMLVFEWTNDGSNGEQFPAAIDNISIVEATCAQPTALNANVNAGTAVITWATTDTTQNSWTLEYKLEDHNEWYAVNADTLSVTLTGLQGSSVYDIRVKANCGTEASEWTVGQFETGCINFVQSENEVTFGTGTSTYNARPLTSYYYHSYIQQLFTEEELAEQGITAGSTISQIGFNYDSSTPAMTRPIQIGLANTEETSLSSSFVPNNEFITVFSSDCYEFTGAENNWEMLTFATPFTYTGGSLVVSTLMDYTTDAECFTQYNGTSHFYVEYLTTGVSRYFYCDGSSTSNNITFDANGQPTTTYTSRYTNASNSRNNIKFKATVITCNDQIACDAPTDVTVKNITTDAATVVWSGDATSYALEYKTGENDWTVVTVNDTTYTFSNLDQKTDYIVRVKAICGENNNSLYTDEVEFTTLSVCPVVTDIVTSNLSTTTTISWTPGGNETAWTLRFRPVGSTEWVTLNISGIASTTFGGLLDQTDYEVEIMALCDPDDEENQSSWAPYTFTSGCAAFDMTYVEEFEDTETPNCWTSEDITFDGTTAAATEAGQWLMTPPITIPAEGNSYIVLDVMGSVNVQASYRGTMLSRFAEIANLGENDEVRHVVIQVPETYKDKAVNFLFLANGEMSIERAEFTQCAFVPVELTAVDPTNNSVDLTWNGLNNNGWVVEYAEAGTDTWTSVNVEQTGDTVEYTLTGLEGATSYDIRVRTLCAGGYASEPSNVVTTTTHCDAISVPFTAFSSSEDANFNCWSNYYSGNYAGNGTSIVTYNNQMKMYNYYNREVDASDIDAFGNVYAVLPKFDTTLNVLQITFTAEQWTANDNSKFQLGVVTDVNHPVETFRQLAEYNAPYYPAATYTYILNNAIDGNLAFRMLKDSLTQEIRISDILVEYIPSCQKPSSLVATPISENSMSLNWSIIGRQNNWDIKYKETQLSFNPETDGTLATANLRPRIITNLEYGQYYTFYIRNHCSSTEQSEWVGPFTYKLEMNYNLANAEDITTCNGNIVFEADTAGTNTMIVRPSNTESWVTLSGNVQLGDATLNVYDGAEVSADNLIATFTGSEMVNLTPACATELTLELTEIGEEAPVVNLAIACADIPTCSAPTKPELDMETLTLTWEPGCWGTPESYNILMTDYTAEETVTLTSTTTSLVITGMVNDHVTTFKVQPVCDGEAGDWSEESEEYVKEACAAPTAVTATYNEAGQTATITWTPAYSTQRNFTVEYKLHDAYSWVSNNVSNATTFTTAMLDEQQVYDVRVKTICADAESEYATTTLTTPCVHMDEAAGVITLGSGTSTENHLPAYTLYNNTLSEQIYTAEEIGMSGTITSVAFYNAGTTKTPNLKIYMVNTEQSSFTTSTDWLDVTERDLLYEGNVQLTAGQWTTINLSTPFEYDGVNNLGLIVDEYMSWSSGLSCRVYSSTSNCAMYVYNDYTDYNAVGATYDGTRVSVKNQVQFNISGIMCNPVVSCPAPSNLEFASVSGESATISWNRGGSENTWTVVYKLNSGEETTVMANDTFYTISGLENSSVYTLDVSVYANCDETHQSEGVSESFNFQTPCPSITTFPFIETFETSSNTIDCWSIIDNNDDGDMWRINTTASYAYNSSRSATIYTDYNNGNNDDYLISPALVLPARSSLSYYYRARSSYEPNDFEVLLSTSGTNPSDFTYVLVPNRSYSNTSYLESDDIDLSQFAGETVYIAFHVAQGGLDGYYLYLDDIKVEEVFSCMPPINLAYSSSTNTLTWDNGLAGTPESYTVEYRTSDAEEYIVLSNTLTQPQYTFTEGQLALNTTYVARVKANCGTEDGESAWAEVTFTTPSAWGLCAYTIEMHDSYGDGWNGNAIYVMVNGELEYTATISSGSSATGEVLVEEGSNVEFVWNEGSYASETSFTITNGSEVIYNCTDGSSLSDEAVFATAFCGTPPTCFAPTDFVYNSATNTLSWTPSTECNSQSYTLEYRLETDSVFTTVTVIDTFYVFPTLPSYAKYEYHVKAICDEAGEDVSLWSPMGYFYSPCVAYTITEEVPYTEDFESYTGSGEIDLANCWYSDESGYTASNGVKAPFVYGNYSSAAHAGVNSLEMKGNQGMAVLPQFTNDINTLSLTFWANRVYTSNTTDALVVGVITDEEDPTTFVGVDTITTVGARGNTTFVGPIDFSNVPANGKIALRYTSTESSQSWNLDDFIVYITPTCGVPENLAFEGNGITNVLSWSANNYGTPESYTLQYRVAESEDEYTTATATDTFYTFPALELATTYEVMVKANCGSTDGLSQWSDPYTFTTPLCLAGFEGEVEFDQNGSSYTYLPFYGYFGYTYSQQIYESGELSIVAGQITSISFKCNTVPSSYNTGGIHIWLGLTDKTSFEDENDYVPVNTLTEVFAMPSTESFAYQSGWNTFTFDTPFEYDGTSNLVVAYYEGKSGYSSSSFYAHTTSEGKAISHYSDNAAEVSYTNPASADASSTVRYYRNDIKLGLLVCPPVVDVEVVSIDPIGDACDLSNAQVAFTVKNNNLLEAITSFTATCQLAGSDNVITETVTPTTAIQPGETYKHTFATVPAYVDGSNDIIVTVNYEGDEDEDNNTRTLADVRQVVPATVPYAQDFSNVVLGRDAWTQGTENDNPNLWINRNGVMTFADNDTMAAQNYFITHCIEIPAGEMQISYDYNALSSLTESMNVYMGTTPDIASMTLIGSHTDFTQADEDYTYNYLFNNANAGIYYIAVEATSQAGNMGVTFDNLNIMPMIDVTVTAGPNGTVTPLGLVKVPYNGDITLNIIPDNMYHTAGVWVDGERVMNEDPFNASFMMYTLDNITEPHTINVEFKMEFHINKYAYNYSDQYTEVGGYFVPATPDTLLNPAGHTIKMVADEHYTLHSLVVGITPPASEGAIIDGDNVIDDVVFIPETRTYTYTFDTLYVSNYYVQACFKMDTVNIHYRVLTGAGIFDGTTVDAGESHDTWLDYGADHTSTILPADGYYTMGVTVNAVNMGIIDHYDFDSVVTTQYVTAQFGHKVTASISNYNNLSYLGSDEVRGTIAPAEQMILSGSSCSVSGTIQEHFHMSNFLVNGVDMLSDVVFNGNDYTFTIDSLTANTDIQAVVRIDTIAIIYTVVNGNGYVNGNEMNAVSSDTLYIDYMSSFLSTFEAATGYHIVNITVNGTAYDEIPQWLTEFITEPQNIVITFALNEYDITTAVHGEGSVSAGVHVVYDPNSMYVFTATPSVGHHISQVMRNNVSLPIADPEAVFTDTIAPILDNYSYVAYIEPNIYTVTASAGANGTIDPYGVQSYEYGSTPTFTVTANAGYAIEEVLVDGQAVTLTNGTYTFAPMTGNHTISATFTAVNYTITATADANGTITPSGAQVVAAGSMPTFTITPATGYQISDVTVDNVSMGAISTYTFEPVQANHTINATFSQIYFTINAVAGANGSISPVGVNNFAYGSTHTFTVAPNAGYVVDYVTVDGETVTLTNNAYTFSNITANHEIFVAFRPAAYTITVSTPNNGAITPSGVVTVGYQATPTFTVTPNTGYEVSEIKVDGVNVIANAVANGMGGYTYTFPAVTANHTLTAVMTQKSFTIVATAGANGSITPNGTVTAVYGSNHTYTITPNNDYVIENVVVDGISMGAISSYTFFNVTANHTISATFKVEPCVVPFNLQVINIDSNAATLTWYHPGADSYDIQYKTLAATTWTLVQNVPGFAYNLTNLQSSTTYIWKVKANTAGCTDADWSNANTFKTLAGPSSHTGVADYVKDHVTVYAEHNRVHIINDYNVEINSVDIYDMYGKLIYNGQANNNPEVIELNVAIGTYVVRLNTTQGPAVYKVHINR